MSGLTRDERARDPVLYDPEKGLKTILVAEAGERHWTRAKDAAKLFEAIKAKLEGQAAYAVWRQDAAVPSQQDPRLRGKRAGIAALRSPLPSADPGKDIVSRWRKRLCVRDKDILRWREDPEKMDAALEDVHHRCVRICEQENANTIRGTEGTGEFERYTPQEYIDAARAVLGEIDLDPASCIQAQAIVRAKTFFTIEDNGLDQEWRGHVFLNPPYHRDLAPQFIDKLIVEIDAKRTMAAILLTNNSTDTQWFQLAARLSQRICFTMGRIRFTTPNDAPVLPTQGQTFFYFGNDVDKFFKVFDLLGFVVAPFR